MSEFIEKLRSSEPVWDAVNKVDKDQADVGLLIEIIRNEFKDWQPPKPLVVVPQTMADFIEEYKEEFKLYGAFYEIEKSYGPGTEIYDWVFQKLNGQDLFARAWIDGYTVEKEKKYIIKHIDMSKLYTDVSLYLAHGFYKELDHVFYKDVNVHNADECHFTQSEIDKLNIGSYEQIEVEP